MRILTLTALVLLLLSTVYLMMGRKNTDMPRQDWQEVFRLSETMKHDETAFTEGLFIHSGDLYESTGLNGESRMVRYKGKSQDKKILEYPLDKDIFAEGSAMLGDKLYLLTWKNKIALCFDSTTLELKGTYEYPREGWGLTSDGKNLIAGDGTDCLYFMNEELQTVKTLHVTCNGKKVTNINELEYDGEFIWANVWLSNDIIAIDSNTGEVQIVLDFSELLPKGTTGDNVLNGIAYDGMYYYFTGKKWPVMYKMERLKNS